MGANQLDELMIRNSDDEKLEVGIARMLYMVLYLHHSTQIVQDFMKD
jgi:hypothetical protein